MLDYRKLLSVNPGKAQVAEIVRVAGEDPKEFKKLIAVFFEGPYRVTQHAAWPLSYIVKAHPDLLTPYFADVLKLCRRKDVHDAVKRNTMRMLQFVEIPRKYHGQVADLATGFLRDRKVPIAIRVFSMTVLANLAEHYPDLKRELSLIISEELPYGSPGFVSRARKILARHR